MKNVVDTSLTTDVVTCCLTKTCAECPGSYINKVLEHAWLCHCRCHTEGLALITGKPESDESYHIVAEHRPESALNNKLEPDK